MYANCPRPAFACRYASVVELGSPGTCLIFSLPFGLGQQTESSKSISISGHPQQMDYVITLQKQPKSDPG